MARRRTLWLSISLLGLVLLGTVIVLSTFSYYLAINEPAYITEQELQHSSTYPGWVQQTHVTPQSSHSNSLPLGTPESESERIPRIIHQTWKTETLPDRWKGLSQGCRDMHPDYEYMLWTDASSREFIAKEYPWFLDTFDDYPYGIQRADAIRYFVLYHYGGVYLDLDIGCVRPMDSLLGNHVILPKTIPVGVSNDLMFAEKGHPFMAQTIHNLVTFNHYWYLNYPTVMFSTGPMFLSLQYGVYTASHPFVPEQPGGEVRILPKSLYGKNAKPGEAPNTFFSHFYGSSWHSDDAAFVGFLGHWGRGLMFVGTIIVVLGLLRLALPSSRPRRRKARVYDVLMPRFSQESGRWQLDFGWFALRPGGTATQPPSPIPLPSPVPSLDEEMIFPPLPPSLAFDLRSRAPSPVPSDRTDIIPSSSAVYEHPVVDAAIRLGHRVFGSVFRLHDPDVLPRARVRRPPRNLFFLPTVLASANTYELPHRHSPPPRYTSPAPQYAPRPEKGQGYLDDLEPASVLGSTSTGISRVGTPAPNYDGPIAPFPQLGNPHLTVGTRTPHVSRPASRQE